MSKKTLTSTVDKDLFLWLNKEAKKQNVSRSSLVNRLLNGWRILDNMTDSEREELKRLGKVRQNVKDGREFSRSNILLDGDE